MPNMARVELSFHELGSQLSRGNQFDLWFDSGGATRSAKMRPTVRLQRLQMESRIFRDSTKRPKIRYVKRNKFPFDYVGLTGYTNCTTTTAQLQLQLQLAIETVTKENQTKMKSKIELPF
ncbi:hypothetical protein PHYBLDRAFT_170983 [Phycomyces blakesleeanus NRRL 1555(-)]|uniref:Uncharacterized protein n=1 Tax=Phycomyces blakesleeanus (strain ATCC 8743b / DSM 1359 / FGSC 10004 / NBRC 33097 / NRRL 1555) TaxID=763407 RepID=A0A163DFJ6_PHYB8|nr:hypothetical protein PHYBLDRAFT_170983 [Phycomyces blakesleeanus NRRL 1555(-)]OAD70900.1 hypothetical protein PHYBLDRAFT_170983 [Phycomyces blakesleeanus NRRL 1555(-)]|eukprot:XP_018288940.1 hypothetical protein PHYBLDRAFT_170983 [Phycomyces blakesleeanus NRRL 1555(-)]